MRYDLVLGMARERRERDEKSVELSVEEEIRGVRHVCDEMIRIARERYVEVVNECLMLRYWIRCHILSSDMTSLTMRSESRLWEQREIC